MRVDSENCERAREKASERVREKARERTRESERKAAGAATQFTVESPTFLCIREIDDYSPKKVFFRAYIDE